MNLITPFPLASPYRYLHACRGALYRLLVGAMSFVSIVVCMANCSLMWGQTTNGSTTATESTRSYSGPLKIVKLLWKGNRQNAANTLAKSISSATERNELSSLREALRSLRAETNAVVAANDLNDPRYYAALSVCLLQPEATPPVHKTIVAALMGTSPVTKSVEQTVDLASVERRQLLWQVWLQVAPDEALEFFGQALTQEQALDANSIAWQSAMISVALRAERNRAGERLLEDWGQLSPATQLAAIEPLTATRESMQLLLDGVSAGIVSKDLINTNQLRKWLASDNVELTTAIEAIWGHVRVTDNVARAQLVTQTLQQINSGARGSLTRGVLIFDRVCSQCHALHGRGYEVGPNIEGNGRGNLQQLISNILDPSLVIGEAFQAKTVLTVDGEVVSGLVVAENDRYLSLKVQGGKTIEFDKQEVEQIKTSNQSLMPEGVEAQMQPQELFDLLAYLSLLKPLGAEENELIPGTPLDFVQP